MKFPLKVVEVDIPPSMSVTRTTLLPSDPSPRAGSIRMRSSRSHLASVSPAFDSDAGVLVSQRFTAVGSDDTIPVLPRFSLMSKVRAPNTTRLLS